MANAQELMDRLDGYIQNQKRARERGDARVIASYKPLISETLNALEALGYDPLECLKICDE